MCFLVLYFIKNSMNFTGYRIKSIKNLNLLKWNHYLGWSFLNLMLNDLRRISKVLFLDIPFFKQGVSFEKIKGCNNKFPV